MLNDEKLSEITYNDRQLAYNLITFFLNEKEIKEIFGKYPEEMDYNYLITNEFHEKLVNEGFEKIDERGIIITDIDDFFEYYEPEEECEKITEWLRNFMEGKYRDFDDFMEKEFVRGTGELVKISGSDYHIFASY